MPRRWYVPGIITVMLAVQIADSITLLVAIVPLVLVCVGGSADTVLAADLVVVRVAAPVVAATTSVYAAGRGP